MANLKVVHALSIVLKIWSFPVPVVKILVCFIFLICSFKLLKFKIFEIIWASGGCILCTSMVISLMYEEGSLCLYVDPFQKF
jgi:hypothetical protein